jgi:nicotinamidase-related amidase
MTTAIVLINCQPSGLSTAEEETAAVNKVIQLVDAARLRHLPVIWTTSHPAEYLESHEMSTADDMAELHAQLRPLFNAQYDFHIRKELGKSLFASPRLEKIMGKEKLRALLLAGSAVDGSIALTARDAAERSIRCSVVTDAVEPPASSSEEGSTDDQQRALEDVLADLDTFGEGDSKVLFDFIPAAERAAMEVSFTKILHEVQWCTMHNRGKAVPRLIAIQGLVDPVTGAQPLYRHPADEQPALVPFTPTVNRIREYIGEKLGQRFNHVLIQYYRDGKDNIGEHSDKTLDIQHGAAIVNYSLGVTRTMILKRKHAPRPAQATTTTAAEEATAVPENGTEGDAAGSGGVYQPGGVHEHQRVTMRDNSLFVLGAETNRKWLHSIRTDKRPPFEKYPDESSFTEASDATAGGVAEYVGRISFTFRTIATCLQADGTITGQGAPASSDESPRSGGDTEEEAMAMLTAFSRENHWYDYTWDELYGRGFRCLNFRIINDAAAADAHT